MKKLKTCYVLPGSLPVILAEFLIVISAAAAFALSLRIKNFGFRTVLLLAATCWLVAIIGRKGKELFYRTAIPAALIATSSALLR